MPQPADLPDDFRDRPFSVGAALRAGVSTERLRRADLFAPFRGVRDRAASLDLEARCAQYSTVMPADAVFSHVTAARLWGLPLPYSLNARQAVDVAVPSGRRLIRARGVAGHEMMLHQDDLTQFASLAVTTPARTLCDLASDLELEQLVAIGDRLLWQRRPLATRENIDATVDRHPGRRGRPKLLVAVGLLTDRADSAPESILRVRFAAAGLPHIEPNLELRRPGGAFVARVDLAFPEFKMAVEYEGDHHRMDADQWRVDLRRVPAIEDVGWHVSRASALDLRDSRPLIAQLRRRLQERGWVRPS